MNPAPSEWIRAAVVALALAAALQPPSLLAQENGGAPSSGAQSPSFEQATRDFRSQRYAAAYGRFARLADAGHVPSACIALLMVREGRALFANDWYASPDQLLRWSAMTIQAARQPPVLQEGDV